MADIRFKDLTTTASSTASDDFIAVDGTTNGTRKLSAFSPTFGGDPVVTGTLTVNGTSLANGLVVNGNGIALNTAGSASIRFQDSGTSKWWFYKLSADPNLYVRDMVNGRMQALFTPGATSGVATTAFYSTVTIDATTASSSASSGALVVGNGTSGGLGVGGAIVAGGTITSTTSTDSGVLQLNLVNSSTGTSASSLFRFNAGTRTASLQAYNDTHATLAGQLRIGTSNGDIVLVPSGVASATFGASSTTFGSTVNVSVGNGTDASLGLNQTGVANAYLTQKATSGNLALGNGGGDQLTIAKTTGVVSITSSSASTSTSSGALVVSGGVGVAGAINAGGPITTGSDGSLVAIYVPGDSAIRAAAGKFYLDTRATDGGDIVLRPRITAALTLAAATGNATFGGNITTAAPSGGTAAAWKLGTVATVSPTSPNRTIEVDIGGTIYYIHAKTTNN